MTPTGRVEALWVKRAHRGPMDAATSVTVDNEGIVGNADRGGRRPITLISAERWEAARRELGVDDLDPTLRRANILVSGVDLEGTRGARLTIGDVELEITTETVPCRLMEFAHKGLMEALKPNWGGGISARVITQGQIAVGDAVTISEGRR